MRCDIGLWIIVVLAAVSSAPPVGAEEVQGPATVQFDDSPVSIQQLVDNGPFDFQGTLRIYMVEPVSRYLDSDGYRYHFGFLCWAGAPVGMSVNTGETFNHSVVWDADAAGFGGVQPDNIVAQAVCFDSATFTNYSDPPGGHPFDVHFADAAAQASPGVPGQDFKSEDFTHTVFLEELATLY